MENEKVHQEAENIFNAKVMYIFLSKDEKMRLVKADSMWMGDLGVAYHRFSYKEDSLAVIGREKEERKIIEFLNSKEKFKMTAITGRAGNGKSKLVYNTLFKSENIKKEWLVYGLNYEELEYFDYCKLCELWNNEYIRKKVLFVIDYVTINASQIGKWIKNLYQNCRDDIRDVYIRIILVERAQVIKNREPYWYVKVVKNNKLDICGAYNDKECIQLNNLMDEQLQDIFIEYVENRHGRYKKLYNKEIDLELCRKAARKIIENLENKCKTPLYIMYIADAWLENNGEIRNWNIEETLEYVAIKEDERISSFFDGDMEQENALKKILIYTMAFNGLNLNKKSFLKNEFAVIQNNFSTNNLGLRQLFGEVGEIEKNQEIILKSSLPEIVCEYYCMRYLHNKKNNDFDIEYIDEFINTAWKENPISFSGFLCRVIEDFSEYDLVSFDNILKMPEELSASSKLLYADVLREYAFWKEDVENYYENLCYAFEQILDLDEDISEDIVEIYVITLFNMAWWCEKNITKKKYIDSIYEQLQRVRKSRNDNICMACLAIEKIKDKKIIEQV